MILIMIITHLLLDFTVQTTNVAERKRTIFKYLALHCVIYSGGVFAVCLLFITPIKALSAAAALSVAHFLVDWIRQRVELIFENKYVKFYAFVIDQILHISIIIAILQILCIDTYLNPIYLAVCQYEDFGRIVLFILLLVTIWDPTSVFIKKMFEFLMSGVVISDTNNQGGLEFGNLIGKLERLIIAVLILLNQYGAIGLVLTAKSIARYSQLGEKDFAEKYLVGTLASISIALIATMGIKKFI